MALVKCKVSFHRSLCCLQLGFNIPGSRKKATNAFTVDDKLNITNTVTAKEFSEMPGSGGVLGTLTFLKNFVINGDKLYAVGMESFEKFRSDIFRCKFATMDMIQTKNPVDASVILRSIGKYPRRFPMDHFLAYYEIANEGNSLLSHEGEDWARVRNAVNKKLLRPQLVAKNHDLFSDVVSDMIARMRHVRDTQGDGLIIPSLPNEMYKWALESISAFLFNQRIGCLKGSAPKESQDFIDAVAMLFKSNVQILGFPYVHRKLNTPMWKNFSSSLNTMFAYARSLRSNQLKKLAANSLDTDTDGTFLGSLLSSKKMSEKEAFATTTELLLAGVDTASNTLCFTLYLLAANPDVQKQLRDEIQLVTKSQILTEDNLKKMTFMKAVFKESQRLYPVGTAVIRIPDIDLVLSGYKVPKETLCWIDVYAMGRDAKFFPEPEKFKPSRWLRDGKKTPDPFASLPFGFGIRSCIGRRIAELEMYILLTRIVQEFELRIRGDGKLNVSQRSVLIPGPELPVEFLDQK